MTTGFERVGGYRCAATRRVTLTALLAVAAAWPVASCFERAARASAIRTSPSFYVTSFPGNDDESFPVMLDNPVTFYGVSYTTFYLNTNGTVTRDAPLSDYTPVQLSDAVAMWAPFWADVDTTNSMLVTAGVDYIDGHLAGAANYIDVGYFDGHSDLLNRFQIVLIDRSDINPGDFDVEFNYEQIQWETGDASGGSGGFGDTSARAGFSSGIGPYYEIPGAGVPGAYLDSNLETGLIYNSLNSDVPGRYVFIVRNGEVVGDFVVPEPSTLMLAACAAAGLLLGVRPRRSAG